MYIWNIMARNKEFNPEECLEIARNLFWEKGYQATSMQDLVKSMKINRASMYDTYGGKRQLFLDSLSDYAQTTFNEYKNGMKEETAIATIENIVNRAINRSFDEKKVCMLVKTSFELAPHDESIRHVLQKLNDDLILLFENIIIRGQQNSEICTEKNPKLLAQFIVGSFAGFWQIQTLYNDKVQVQQLASILLNCLR